MKKISRLTTNVFLGLALAIACAVTVRGQTSEQYTISAKAGGTNFVSGNTMLKRKGEERWQKLMSSDDLESGDVVRTGADGRVEMLLSPGSYLRAAENTEFELADNSLDSLRVRLMEGSAVVEVAGADEARMEIQVDTPQARVSIDRKGLYRINTMPGGATEVLVRKGEAMVGSDQTKQTKVKDGKKAVVSGANLAVAKFKKEDQDAFDQWSKQRGEELVAINRSLSKQTISNSLSSFRSSPWGRLGSYSSFAGLWVYDPFYRCRTFLPFYSGWSSPYGHGYSQGFGLPWHHHHLSNGTGNVSSGFPSGTGSGHGGSGRDDLGNGPHSRSAHRAPGHAPSHSSVHRRGRH